jgi:hypothetical protein
MEVPVKGGVVVGIADLYHNKTITDWKVTSVFSYLLSKSTVYNCPKCGGTDCNII